MTKYINTMNNQFGRKQKILRTDNGKEYVNKELRKYLARQCIQHQQNDVTKFKNRSPTEMIKYMLLKAGPQNRFWGESVLTAVYLQNRLSSRTIDKTPYELSTGSQLEKSY